jgi:predicted lipoprotein with Yx(FWY)xxD motif
MVAGVHHGRARRLGVLRHVEPGGSTRVPASQALPRAPLLVRVAVAVTTAVLVPAVLLSVDPNQAGAASRLHGPTDVVKIVRTPEGRVIANGAGMTLYVFVDDLLTRAPSACVGDCRNDWPPALASGRLRVVAGVTGRIGTINRFGQGRQLTMDGRPLYTFSGDTPGEIRGNGVGNLWWAMTPSGLAATSFPSVPSTYGPARPQTLTVVQTKLGPVVANDRGQVLYAYSDDTPTTSACNADWCLVDWPPLQASGTPTAVGAVTAPVSMIRGAGGVDQVTLGGHPLYTFAGDLHPGDTRGEGIGSDWYLVSPAGTTVMGHG